MSVLTFSRRAIQEFIAADFACERSV